MCVLSLQKSHDADQDDADEGIKELTELALKKLVILTECVGGLGGWCACMCMHIYTHVCVLVCVHAFLTISTEVVYSYCTVWFLHGWCHVKLLLFWCIMCTPYNHLTCPVTSCKATYI